MSAAAPSLVKVKLRGVPAQALSEREEQVVMLIAVGLCTKEIAVRLRLAVKTVETHRHNIHVKLGVDSQVWLVHYALAHNLVPNRFQSGSFYGS